MNAKNEHRAPPCDEDHGTERRDDDTLSQFKREQSRKCSVHNRKQTDEVLALIRKYRKD